MICYRKSFSNQNNKQMTNYKGETPNAIARVNSSYDREMQNALLYFIKRYSLIDL